LLVTVPVVLLTATANVDRCPLSSSLVWCKLAAVAPVIFTLFFCHW